MPRRWLAGLAAVFGVGGCTPAGPPFAPGSLAPGTAVTLLRAEGMNCQGSCDPQARAALQRIDGFVDARSDTRDESLWVAYDPQRTTPQRLADAISRHSTFRGSVVREDVPVESEPGHLKKR